MSHVVSSVQCKDPLVLGLQSSGRGERMLFINGYTTVEPFYSGWLGIGGFGLELWNKGNDMIFNTENIYIFHFIFKV
jgi:hypothetical protein